MKDFSCVELIKFGKNDIKNEKTIEKSLFPESFTKKQEAFMFSFFSKKLSEKTTLQLVCLHQAIMDIMVYMVLHLKQELTEKYSDKSTNGKIFGGEM